MKEKDAFLLMGLAAAFGSDFGLGMPSFRSRKWRSPGPQNCVACGQEIPPGKPGRKCRQCREAPQREENDAK